jgi:hypothetical protein
LSPVLETKDWIRGTGGEALCATTPEKIKEEETISLIQVSGRDDLLGRVEFQTNY